jgi:N-glycosylase/DNA lyase
LHSSRIFIPVRDYDLAATLQSGQAFRWRWTAHAWEGMVGRQWVRLCQQAGGLEATVAEPVANWSWLRDYLQTDVDLDDVLATFPDDEPMRLAVRHARGLRLLRQDPWECLASFILSSTKRIAQIQQIIGLLCERFGERVAAEGGDRIWHAFPTPGRLAACGELELRACKMGFRAPGLLSTGRLIASGAVDLDGLRRQSVDRARAELVALPGVGRKIADCVLLFAYGFEEAFPVDVWVAKALRELYFPRRKPSPPGLDRFVRTHFGPHAGFAQQYLFHYMRTRGKLDPQPDRA